MTRVSGQLKSSVNSGQLAQSLLGKVNLKQYYSGAKLMRGVEPIPQSGFQLLPGSAYVGAGVTGICNKAVLRVDKQLSYTLVVSSGQVDIYRNDRVKVATLTGGLLDQITDAMVSDLSFYGEANTFGIFHPDIWQGIRLFRDAGDDTSWTIGAWPFGLLPEVDLGGSYVKTDDVWTVYVRWSSDVTSIQLSVTIDGNTTDAIAVTLASWGAFPTAAEAAIADLPGFASGVSVSLGASGSLFQAFDVTFGGVLTGSEYDFNAAVLDTTSASALPAHTTVGKTDGEPLISETRGGFGVMGLFQDRAVYAGPKAKGAAIAMSASGEYFDLGIKSQTETAGRLEALRTESSETVLHIVDATYLLAFTNQAVYFASNRTVKRNEPLNWVRAIEIGSKKSCQPVTLEGRVYFVSDDGGRLYSAAYDAVSEMFQPTPENDLNGGPEDLVTNIKMMKVQKKTSEMISDRLWIVREDGRLVCCVINKTQEIMAAVEWSVFGGGLVRALAVDGQGQVWLTIERGGVISEEILEEERHNLFQHAFAVTTDLTGQASGLALLNGKTVWATIDNDVYGPFVVAAGAVQTDVPSKACKIGLWAAPLYESMPYVRVLPNDDIVRRPGKVGSARLYVRDTASLAIGANGRPPRDVSLNRTSDDLSQPKTNFTGHVNVAGLIGACMDPTLVISQVRPGRLNVRDYVPGVKL